MQLESKFKQKAVDKKNLQSKSKYKKLHETYTNNF